MKDFNDYDYTREAIIKQLVLMELHGKDGSATDAGCACIETKHTYMLEGLAEEMVGFAKSEKEKKFYSEVSELMRLLRKKIDQEDFSLHGVMAEVKGGSPGYVNISASCQKDLAKCLENNPLSVCEKTVKCLV